MILRIPERPGGCSPELAEKKRHGLMTYLFETLGVRGVYKHPSVRAYEGGMWRTYFVYEIHGSHDKHIVNIAVFVRAAFGGSTHVIEADGISTF